MHDRLDHVRLDELILGEYRAQAGRGRSHDPLRCAEFVTLANAMKRWIADNPTNANAIRLRQETAGDIMANLRS